MRHLRVLFVAFCLISLAGCSSNPATGGMQFNMVNESQELSMGEQTEPGFVQSYGGELPSPEVVKYVAELGARLAASSERASLPWRFHVVDSSVINAFALPGGKIFITRGLLQSMTNEAQLAGVLGHEVGHVTAQHIGQQMSRQTAVESSLAVLTAVAGASVQDEQKKGWIQTLGSGASSGAGLYLLKFGRDQESEADSLGLRYMSKQGYNPEGMLQVMAILKQASGGGGSMEILATHPLPDTRVDRINKLLKESYPDRSQLKFFEAQFKTNVLDKLSKLPPAKHKG